LIFGMHGNHVCIWFLWRTEVLLVSIQTQQYW